MRLIADEVRGIYAPQTALRTMRAENWSGINPDDAAIVEAGPDHEEYWAAWDDICRRAKSPAGETVLCDGDIFAVGPEEV